MLKTSIPKGLLFFFILIGFSVLSCQSAEIQPTATVGFTKTIPPSETPQAIHTTQSSPKPYATVTAPPPPIYCSTETIPSELLPTPSEKNYTDKLIAFMAGEDGYDDIYVMNIDGTDRRNITNNPAVDRFPVWSPDGKRIAFLSNRNYPATNECRNMVSNECVFEIFTMNRNGAGLTQVSRGWNFSPVWSPNSQMIAYLYLSPAPYSTPNSYGDREFIADIYVVNADHSSKPVNLTQQLGAGHFSNPVWSPDNKRLAFTTETGIAIINSDGSGLLEYSQKDVSDLMLWLPNNEYILFYDRDGAVYKIKTDFSSIEKLPFQVESFRPLTALSPDGKWLTYSYSYFSQSGVDHCSQIRVFNMDTFQDYFVFDLDSVKTITRNSSDAMLPSGLGVSSVNWVSNDQLLFTQWIHFQAILGEFEELFIINLDGTELQTINSDGEVSAPSVQP